MAVEQQSVGQQVHCPHCQQTVQTVAPCPEAGDAARLDTTTVSEANAEAQESIFNPPEQASDALFGEPIVPNIELPHNVQDPPALVETPCSENILSSLPQSGDVLFGSAVSPAPEAS